jgi:hypothetical protein
MRNAAISRPTAAKFHQAVVYLIGKLSGWKPYITVQASDVLDDALSLVGIDPKNSPWPLIGRDGLYRRVGFAVRNQTRKSCGNRPAYCTILGKNEWALTALGLTESKSLRDKFEGTTTPSHGPNVTAQWIDENYRKLYKRLHSYLERKMPVSAKKVKVEDHIQTFFCNLINRDGLRTRIEEGKSIPYSQVCAWARRSAYSEIRDEGPEPVCRLFHGALTKKEIGNYDPSNWTTEVVPSSINKSEQLNVNPYASHSDEGGAVDTMDFLADTHNMEEEILDEDAFGWALEAVGEAIHKEIDADKDPEWHEQLMVDRFVVGLTVKELAEKHGIDRNKATVALGRIRKAVIRHKADFDSFRG